MLEKETATGETSDGQKKTYRTDLLSKIESVDSQAKNENYQKLSDNFKTEKKEAYAAIDQMVERWPSTLVARKAIDRFTGYAFSPKTLSNADARKRGPENAIKINGHVCYPVESLARWLKRQVREV